MSAVSGYSLKLVLVTLMMYAFCIHTGRECLSPPLTVMMNRPIPMVVDKSNTTLTLEWEEPVLSPECSDVFSFPPLSYTIVVANPQINPFLFLNMVRTCTFNVTVC